MHAFSDDGRRVAYQMAAWRCAPWRAPGWAPLPTAPEDLGPRRRPDWERGAVFRSSPFPGAEIVQRMVGKRRIFCGVPGGDRCPRQRPELDEIFKPQHRIRSDCFSCGASSWKSRLLPDARPCCRPRTARTPSARRAVEALARSPLARSVLALLHELSAGSPVFPLLSPTSLHA